ncbi:unnamed protein product [Mytilus edulis]|uniref:IRS-type PTB domain-containing protein n=1 Tax=Mytilus edulis TaxID=6550 RepID=A0A8S3QEC2_MYTED|nr:unnamed protein product [Mytilus edulis]
MVLYMLTNIRRYLLVSSKVRKPAKHIVKNLSHIAINMNVLVVQRCCKKEHKNCKELQSINDINSSIKSSYNVLEIDHLLIDIIENLKKIQQNRAGNLTSLKLNRQNIEREIQIARQTMNNHFDNLERELLKGLQTIANDEMTKSIKFLASVDRKEKEIDELKISLAIIKQHASDLQTFLVSKQIEHELVDTDIFLQSMQDSSELSDVSISVKTDDLLKNINGNISKFGEIVVQTSKNSMSLVRRKIRQKQEKVANVAEASPDDEYDTIINEEDPCFIVTVKPIEDALKFGLNGQYRLRVTQSGFILENIEKMTPKCCWSFNIVRKFGKTGIEKEFAITVGRRNLLGEGTVAFMCSSRDDPGKISCHARIIIKKMQSEVKH